jgi:hypothetical protein
MASERHLRRFSTRLTGMQPRSVSSSVQFAGKFLSYDVSDDASGEVVPSS